MKGRERELWLEKRVEELEKGLKATADHRARVEAERDEWRDTARSEMAGRRAAEAEVKRLRESEAEYRRLTDAAHDDMREENSRLRAALEKLLNAMETVHADERYKAVWTISFLHIGPYVGPTYVAELEAARAAIAPEVK
jgi:DNA repair exonuclease SbcCD ATPase subunit